MKLNDTQLKQVDRQVKRLLQSDNYYGKVYREAGITGITSQEEFEQLPFSSKVDLRNAYPLGIQAVPDEEVVRIHSSSGTTGKPVIIPYTAKDVNDWATMFARCYEMVGITNKDRIQITPGYGLWTAGIGFQAGCEKLGAMAVPMGPGNTDKQLQMMIDLKTTVLTATSSYALLLAEEINKRGLKDQIFLKKGVFGSERWSEKMREYIQRELGIELYDIYGQSRGAVIASGFSNLFAFKTIDAESRDYVSKVFGKNYYSMSYFNSAGEFVDENREGQSVEDWELMDLQIGHAVIGLANYRPFYFTFKEYKSKKEG